MGFRERGSIEFKDYTQVSDTRYTGYHTYYGIYYFFLPIHQDGESVFDLRKMGEHTSGVIFMANIES